MEEKYRLIQGDCIEYVKKLSSEMAIVSDVPYGIDYSPDWKKWDGSQSDFEKIEGDKEPFDPSHLLRFQYVSLWGGNYYSDKLPIGTWAIWDKRTNSRLDRMHGSPAELAWVKSDEPQVWMIRVLHGGVINVDSKNGNNEKRLHPTQKPITLFEQLILKMKIPKEVVIVDPYMGSGSCGIAAMKLGYKFIGYEIVPKYFSIAEKRIKAASQQMNMFTDV